MSEIKMDNITYTQCPTCGAEIESYRKFSKHVNGHWNEVVTFKCGCSLEWSPNFMNYTNSRNHNHCPKHADVVKEINDRRVFSKKIKKYIKNADVDEKFKNRLLSDIQYTLID